MFMLDTFMTEIKTPSMILIVCEIFVTALEAYQLLLLPPFTTDYTHTLWLMKFSCHYSQNFL